MFGELRAIDCADKPKASSTTPDISLRSMESLWVRLKAGDRIRPRDAQLLKRLAIPPFDGCGIYELNANGYVVAVGLPDSNQRLDAGALLFIFESRYGIPVTYSDAISTGDCRAYGT
jgi:hypothetical protein